MLGFALLLCAYYFLSHFKLKNSSICYVTTTKPTYFRSAIDYACYCRARYAFFVHINIDIDCMTSFGRNIDIFFCFITKSQHCALIEAEKNSKPIGMWYIVKCSYSQWKICEYANESQWMERERRESKLHKEALKRQ